MMNNRIAINVIKDALEIWEEVSDVDEAYWEAQPYIEAYKLAKTTIEKQIPKKVKRIYKTIPECLVCGLAVQQPFPCRCGQMIDYKEDSNEDT